MTPAELDAIVALLAVYVGYPRASIAGEIVQEELARPSGSLDATYAREGR